MRKVFKDLSEITIINLDEQEYSVFISKKLKRIEWWHFKEQYALIGTWKICF